MSLDAPISYENEEGSDKWSDGTDDSGQLAESYLPQIPLYSVGSERAQGITAPDLYPTGLYFSSPVCHYSHLVHPLQEASWPLRKVGLSLTVVSGFLSPRNQLERWRILYERKNPHSPAQEILAGRYADSAGSVAMLVDGEGVEERLAHQLQDEYLTNELRTLITETQDVRFLVKELLQYRANAGTEKMPIDPMTATSVHNFGHSVNMVLTDTEGVPLNMGVGVDIVSPAQRVDYFESAEPREYEQLVEKDSLLASYLEQFGAGTINEELMTEIRTYRRVLFHAMRAQGFDFYRGEQGHFSLRRENGDNPSRSFVYKQAEERGIKIV